MGSRIPTNEAEPDESDRANLAQLWLGGRRRSVQTPSTLESVHNELAASVPARARPLSLAGSGWSQQRLDEHGSEFEEGATTGASGNLFGGLLIHADGSSATVSGLSVQSAPAQERRANSASSHTSGPVIGLDGKRGDQISTLALGTASQTRSATVEGSKRQPSRKVGPFEVSEEKFAELVSYRCSLAILALAFIYTLFALTLMLFKSSSHTASEPNRVVSARENNPEWTQEEIDGWHKEQNLALARDFLQHKMSPMNIRVRDCKSYAAYSMQQYSTLVEQVLVPPTGNATRTTTTGRPTARPKRLFAALNGCMFRRDGSSDSLGDLCCCAGIPKFKPVNSTMKSTASGKGNAARTTTSPTSKGARRKLLNSTATTSPSARREYERPQLMCFASASGSLFNSQKLVAPLVNEYNLRKAHIADKGKCIPCSCCHEHEPEMVNKLLANVPLASARLDATSASDSLARPATSGDSSTGVWPSVRKRLSDSMRSLDEFLFHIYDLLDLAFFTLRHGAYPIENVPANSVPFMSDQFYVTASRLATDQLESELPVKELNKSPKSLLIDGDTYEDFTTTTTSSSTTSTSRKPSAKRRRKKPKMKAARSRNGTAAAHLSGSESGPSEVTVFIGKTRVGPVSGKNDSRKLASSSTTKSPTFIINVYAGAHGGSDSKLKLGSGSGSSNSTSRKPGGQPPSTSQQTSRPTTQAPGTTSTTSSSRAPSITLVAAPGAHSAPSGTNIRLQIELAAPTNSNHSARASSTTSSTTTTTKAPANENSWPVPAIRPSEGPLAIAISGNLNLPAPSVQSIMPASPFVSAKTLGNITATSNTSSSQDGQRILLIWPPGDNKRPAGATSEAPRKSALSGNQVRLVASQESLPVNGSALLQAPKAVVALNTSAAVFT